MKKSLLIAILFSHYISVSQIYYQYFDGFHTNPNNSLIIHLDTLAGNVWQIGKPSKTLFNNANTLPKAIVTDTVNDYPENNISRFTFALPHNIFSMAPIALQWTQKLDLDFYLDGGVVEFSNDSITWENAAYSPFVYQFYGFNPSNLGNFSMDAGFSGTDNTWRDVWLCIDPYYCMQNDTLFYRFTLMSDNTSSNHEGWMIDNMQGRPTIIHPVKETSQIDDIVVYPNISTGMVNIEIKKTKLSDVIDNIEMIDQSGKIVEVFGKNFTKVVLDIKKHKPGLYYFRVTTNNKTKLFKVIYEKN